MMIYSLCLGLCYHCWKVIRNFVKNPGQFKVTHVDPAPSSSLIQRVTRLRASLVLWERVFTDCTPVHDTFNIWYRVTLIIFIEILLQYRHTVHFCILLGHFISLTHSKLRQNFKEAWHSWFCSCLVHLHQDIIFIF